MKKKSLAILMRARMATPTHPVHQQQLVRTDRPPPPQGASRSGDVDDAGNSTSAPRVVLKDVKEWMQASISVPTEKTEPIDANIEKFSQGYLGLSQEGRRELLLELARDYDVNRARVCELMQQYLNVELPHGTGADAQGAQESNVVEDGGALAMFFRMERNLRDALKPLYAGFFEKLNTHPGGLKLLTTLRADLLALPVKENVPSLRALEAYLKEKLITWLSPASLELHQITWDDSASLLEKIVAYEAVHPIRNLLDLKRRLSEGRRCFGYFHPAIPGEPLIFIEVALLKDIAASIQEVLWDSPPTPEIEATCALFYSISATQPGLSGINLGKFLIKRVIYLLRRDMPHITAFATLSPIPGFMQWLISKLASQIKLAKWESEDMKHISEKGSGSNFREDILLPDEEVTILSSYIKWFNSGTTSEIEFDESEFMDQREHVSEKSAMEIMYEILTSRDWSKSVCLRESLKPSLLRLCARYLLKEKKRGKALDAVANFHLQNGSMVERINWMADHSDKGIEQSGGIMVNYVYRLDKIDTYAQSYLNTGHIHASCSVQQYLQLSSDELDHENHRVETASEDLKIQ
ncbi:malonyl-CoA decarboxylase, mitochondrial isoform X2 [Canna indica]|uniref:Malonyl-CoA decarboxylase, mitochondrial isoform X2 n=1 Tax=Canna indica TaxID=4628 RepID=A0AAQ3QIP3_9LILI|nr:malonyl-CoA decarboxylase, mitochondrial isoform X2 [Canna indica]